MTKKLKNKGLADWIGWLLFAAGIFLAAAAFFACGGTDIWYDELFTMGFANQSVVEIIGMTARDVHPPFYYLYVKAVVDGCGFLFPMVSPVVIGKICSVLPFFLLLIYAGTTVRRHFGILSAGLFSFCIISMPQIPQYATEIRMYSMALFLVTAALLHGYEIMCGSGRKRDWAALTVYGVLAAYTHYFACAAIAVLYLGFLCLAWKQRKTKSGLLRNAVWGAGITGVCYLPWVFVLISQVAQVKESYWILPLTIRSLFGCVKFLLKPAFLREWVNYLVAVLLFLIYGGFAACAVWKRREKRREDSFAFFCILMLAGVVAVGFAASFLIRPVFIYRYMLPVMGAFWLGFAVWSGRYLKRMLFLIPVILLIAAVGITGYTAFYREEAYKTAEMERTKQALAQIDSGDVVIFNFNQIQAVIAYYLSNATYLWNAEPEPLILELVDHAGAVYEAAEIRDWLVQGEQVWFLGSGNARENLIAEWSAEGIEASEEASCLLERYWFNLYRLSIK